MKKTKLLLTALAFSVSTASLSAMNFDEVDLQQAEQAMSFIKQEVNYFYSDAKIHLTPESFHTLKQRAAQWLGTDLDIFTEAMEVNAKLFVSFQKIKDVIPVVMEQIIINHGQMTEQLEAQLIEIFVPLFTEILNVQADVVIDYLRAPDQQRLMAVMQQSDLELKTPAPAAGVVPIEPSRAEFLEGLTDNQRRHYEYLRKDLSNKTLKIFAGLVGTIPLTGNDDRDFPLKDFLNHFESYSGKLHKSIDTLHNVHEIITKAIRGSIPVVHAAFEINKSLK